MGGKTDGHKQPLGAQQPKAKGEPGHGGRKHDAGVHPADLTRHLFKGVVGADRHVGAQRLDELQPGRADVDADHLVAQRLGDLHRIVAQPASGADDGHPAARGHLVAEQLLHRPVGGEPAAGQGGLVVAHRFGQHHQRLGPHAELLGEGAHDPLGLRAVPGLAPQAELAGPAPETAAGAPEPEDHPVAHLAVALRARPQRLHHADGLVAQHLDARDTDPVAPGQVEVGVAHPRRGDADQRLLKARLRHRYVQNAQVAVNQSCCLHVGFLPRGPEANAR